MASTSSSQPDATFVCKYCKTEICKAVEVVNKIGGRDYQKSPSDEINLTVPDGAYENPRHVVINFDLYCPGCGFTLAYKRIREWQGDTLVEIEERPRLHMKHLYLKIGGVFYDNDLNPVND